VVRAPQGTRGGPPTTPIQQKFTSLISHIKGPSARNTLLRDQLDRALTLEVGKNRRRRCHTRKAAARGTSVGDLRVRFVVEPYIADTSLNRAILDDGRQHGEQDQGARARPAIGACATRPGHAVNVLTEECLCKASDTLAQPPCSSTAVRATAGSSARASELSNLACR
jgi:hypothetical protein